MAFLVDVLGLTASNLSSIRYQLLHRTASAVIEAERLGATAAVMIVHSFSSENLWFQDYAAFVGLFGIVAGVDRLSGTSARNGLPLYLGWAHGNERFLKS